MLFYYLCTKGEGLHRQAYPQGAQSKDADVFKWVTMFSASPAVCWPKRPPISNGSSAQCAGQLKALANSVRNAGITRVGSSVRPGLAAHEIVEAAKELDVDLIVIATHGYTGWKHFAIGSTAERVVRAAPCPVLVVREKEHEFV